MNKRKLRRSRERKIMKTQQFEISEIAKTICNNAINGIPSLEYQRGLIFFSTQTGEAWILDFDGNLSLRLADGYKKLNYRIVETKTNFLIEWKETFVLEGSMFMSIHNGKASVITTFPATELLMLLNHEEKERCRS